MVNQHLNTTTARDTMLSAVYAVVVCLSVCVCVCVYVTLRYIVSKRLNVQDHANNATR